MQTTLCYVFVLHGKHLVINLTQCSWEFQDKEIKSSNMLSLRDVFTRYAESHDEIICNNDEKSQKG